MPQPNRARALIAIGAFLGFGVLIAVILIATSGGSERDFTDAPAECIEAWNGDREAVRTGTHNALSHLYTFVQVGYATAEVDSLEPEPVAGGGCVVVFARSQLDPEPFAAGEIRLGGRWEPLSTKVDLPRLTALQSEALEDYNAKLRDDGTLVALR